MSVSYPESADLELKPHSGAVFSSGGVKLWPFIYFNYLQFSDQFVLSSFKVFNEYK